MKHQTINIYGRIWENDGTVQVPYNQDLTFRALYGGYLVNNGTIYVSGSMTVAANLSQGGFSGDAQIDVINNGHVTMLGSADGGIIGIQSGMLEFARSPMFQQPATGSYSASNFRSGLSFAGSSGAIEFDGAGRISINYRQDLQDILVSNRNGQVADIHLIDGFNPYTSAEFSTNADKLVFHFIRV